MIDCKDCKFCYQPRDYRDGEAQCDKGRTLTQKGDYTEDNWKIGGHPRPVGDDCEIGEEA